MDDAEDVGDIEALARSTLAPGELLLDGNTVRESSAGINNTALMNQRLRELEYKVPAEAKRVPWVDTLAIDSQREMSKGVSVKDGVKLEALFVEIAGESVQEAYRRLRVMQVPCSRPPDFYAEMLRDDKQMYKVRARAAEETRRITIVEDRKKSQAGKKFAKKAKAQKQEARAEEKRKTLDNIKDWKKQTKEDGKTADDQDLEAILNKQQAEKRPRGTDPRKPVGKSKKAAAKDAKFGFGGKKRAKKRNDAASSRDMSSLSGKKVKGKGKGKSAGGKGKGKGKGKKR
uniref:rRNA-processing protein EBP2 n=1 Tax=Noctiluca scintillans TaxID=2966 RepID=A0A7S1FAY9_NOCSC